MFAFGRAAVGRLGRLPIGAVGVASCGVALHRQHSECHAHHPPPRDERLAALEQRLELLEADIASRYGIEKTTGQADAVFSWDEGLTAAFPDECKPHEVDMHGGFSEDPSTGKIYTGIPGCGLFEISADLTAWRRIGTDPRLKANIHGLAVFSHDGATSIALAQNDAERVLITNLDGHVVQQLDRPCGGEFRNDEVNAYYSERRQSRPAGAKTFCCTDVTYLHGRLYVVTGYSEGDFVLTATHQQGQWMWGGAAPGEGVAWGGRGDVGGRFRTAHGVYAHDDHVYVANREAFQVIKFTPTGQLVEVLPEVPRGARICNVSHAERHAYFVFNALAPLGGHDGLPSTAARTAPIYFHSGRELVSVVEPGRLGIPILKHIHHVHPHYAPDGTLYLLVHGWRDGKYAVLRHVNQRAQ